VVDEVSKFYVQKNHVGGMGNYEVPNENEKG
jgi:hypothetical protein